MNAPLMALLRLAHILAGIFWVGATLVIAGFLLPAMREIGPGAGPYLRQVMIRRRLRMWINIAMALTILAGFALYGIESAASSGTFARSTMGKTLGLGALLAIIAAGVTGAMTQPAGKKLDAMVVRLADGQRTGAPPSAETLAEMQALQVRSARGLAITSVLLLLSAAAMAVARYL